jgi:tetratricopeptide (TPR) repeat protein
MDLRRHLANRPVFARPDRLAYRLSSFVRRHPTGLAATALILLAVTVGSIATASQAQRARDRFEGTRSLANSMLRDLNEALEDLPGGTRVRAMLVSQALTYLEELREDPQADSELLLEVADAYSQIGTIQGNPYYTNLGDLAAARVSYEAALELREQVWTQDTNDPDARQAVADSYGQMALLTAAEGDLTESTRLAELALEVLGPLREVRGENDEFLKVLGRIRAVLGGNLVFEGAFDEGLAELAEAVALMEEIADRRPDDLELRMELWQAYANQMDGWRFSGQFEPALAVLEEGACPMLTRLEARHPTRPAILYALHECYDYVGALQEYFDLPEAVESYRLGLAKAEALRELDPANERANLAVSISLVSIGRKMFLEGRLAEGQPMLEEALAIRLAMREQNPANVSWIRLIASVQRELCRGLLNSGDPDGALRPCLDAVRTHEENIQRDRAGAIAEVTLAYALGHTGRVFRDLARRTGDETEGERLLTEAMGSFQRSIEAYERADLPDDSVWEIPPDEIRADLEAVTQLLRGTGHRTLPRS